MSPDLARPRALLLTSQKKIEAFDSIEALATFVSALGTEEQPRGMWVANCEHAAQWIDARQATYLHRTAAAAPLPEKISAYAADIDRDVLVHRFGGRAITWSDVLNLSAPSHHA